MGYVQKRRRVPGKHSDRQMTDIKNVFSKNRILIAAIAISLAWHVFWLSAVKIVVAPGASTHVKFSRVAFLGPLLEKGGMELSAEPPARSVLEKRYRDRLEEQANLDNPAEEISVKKYVWQEKDPGFSGEKAFTELIDSAISTQKLEPK